MAIASELLSLLAEERAGPGQKLSENAKHQALRAIGAVVITGKNMHPNLYSMVEQIKGMFQCNFESYELDDDKKKRDVEGAHGRKRGSTVKTRDPQHRKEAHITHIAMRSPRYFVEELQELSIEECDFVLKVLCLALVISGKITKNQKILYNMVIHELPGYTVRSWRGPRRPCSYVYHA